MDRFLYVAMTGAREAQLSQAVASHNLANVSTTGFRATLAASRPVPLEGPGHAAARAYAVTEGYGVDVTPGPMQTTGRDLDVAVVGEGWIAVQAADGGEAYTRAGDFTIDALGLLTTRGGAAVLGEGGPIALPPFESIEIGVDGTVSIRPQGQVAAALVVVDRIRLVNPPPEQLRRGADGLLRTADGLPPPAAGDVSVRSGMLEGSNVNVVSAMVNMIEDARSFELQIELMNTAEDNDRASAELMRLG